MNRSKRLEIAVQHADNEWLRDIVIDELVQNGNAISALIERVLHDGQNAKIGADLAKIILNECDEFIKVGNHEQ